MDSQGQPLEPVTEQPQKKPWWQIFGGKRKSRRSKRSNRSKRTRRTHR